MSDLYENIKKRRKELRLTQTDLAGRLGYADKSAIAKIEKGIVDLPQSKIKAFADALRTTPAYLMGWDESEDQTVEYFLNTVTKICDKLEDAGYKLGDAPDGYICVILDGKPILYEESELVARYEKNTELDISRILTGELSSQAKSYYTNPETAKIAQEIYENKDLSLLFDAARDAEPEDLQTVHTMLLALKKKERGE